MKLYRFNYFCNYECHSGEQLALFAFDVERNIRAANPNATDINVWFVRN